MPPSPRVKITLNETKYREVCAELKLSEPPTFMFREHLAKGQKTTGGTSGIYGVYQKASNTVQVFTEKPEYLVERFRAVNAELVITALHELRHAWQWQEGSPYRGEGVRQSELDAEGWAQSNYHKWRGLIQISRVTFRRKLPG